MDEEEGVTSPKWDDAKLFWLAPLFTKQQFFGRWAPVRYEPIVNSREGVTVAIAAVGADGSVLVRRVLSDDRLAEIYGAKATVIADCFDDECAALALALREGRDPMQAISVQGFTIDEFRQARSASIEGLIRQGEMVCAGFDRLRQG